MKVTSERGKKAHSMAPRRPSNLRNIGEEEEEEDGCSRLHPGDSHLRSVNTWPHALNKVPLGKQYVLGAQTFFASVRERCAEASRVAGRQKCCLWRLAFQDRLARMHSARCALGMHAMRECVTMLVKNVRTSRPPVHPSNTYSVTRPQPVISKHNVLFLE